MIRPARPEDAAAVIELVIEADLFPSGATLPVEEALTEFLGGSTEHGPRFLVDADDDSFVGVAYYQPKPATDRVWDLTLIAVRPALQGRGRGTALLHDVEEALRTTGQRILLVETSGRPQFDSTRAFYAKCGYDEVARVADYWETGDPLILFLKNLGR